MTDTTAKTIGANIRRARGGMSQEALARVMVAEGFPTWSQATVWSTEAGDRRLLFAEGVALQRILDCDLTADVDRPELPEPKNLGAVVQDAEGLVYVRAARLSRESRPFDWVGPDGARYTWAGTEAVRVLAEGVLR